MAEFRQRQLSAGGGINHLVKTIISRLPNPSAEGDILSAWGPLKGSGGRVDLHYRDQPLSGTGPRIDGHVGENIRAVKRTLDAFFVRTAS